MGEKLIIRYDEIGSFLFIEVCDPYAQQDSNEIDSAVVARFNLETGEMESVEILFFESWLRLEGEIRIPVTATLWPVSAATPKELAQPPTTEATLVINYDHTGDTLTIDKGRPYPGQSEYEIVEGVVTRLNPATGEIENLEIRSFKARLERDGEVVLPINATFRLAEAVAAIDGGL